jgi:hypothetical protein
MVASGYMVHEAKKALAPLKDQGAAHAHLPHPAWTITLTSPRLYHCRCQRRKTTTCRPLTALLTASTAFAVLARPVSGGICHTFSFVIGLEYDLPVRLRLREGER